jgi:hypothetical protein
MYFVLGFLSCQRRRRPSVKADQGPSIVLLSRFDRVALLCAALARVNEARDGDRSRIAALA